MILPPAQLDRLNQLLLELQSIRGTPLDHVNGPKIEGEMFEIMEPVLRAKCHVLTCGQQDRADRDDILQNALCVILARIRNPAHLARIKCFTASLNYFTLLVRGAARDFRRKRRRALPCLSDVGLDSDAHGVTSHADESGTREFFEFIDTKIGARADLQALVRSLNSGETPAEARKRLRRTPPSFKKLKNELRGLLGPSRDALLRAS